MPVSPAAKTSIAIKCTCLFWLIAKIICYKLWLTDRLFPLVPPFKFLLLPPVFHVALFSLSLLLLVALLVFPVNKKLLIILIISELVSCSLDQNRWQPWEYQYIFMIAACIINYKNDKNIIAAITFIFISTYLFSGAGKINPAFLRVFWYQMILLDMFHLPRTILYNWTIYHAGYLLGLFEIACGIGLFMDKLRKKAAYFLIVMHVIILLALGPWGMNYDTIVWPWNIAMICFLYLLFIKKDINSISFENITLGWNKLIFICWGLLPALSFVGLWDYYLSSSLFSVRPPSMIICVHKTGKDKALSTFFEPAGYKTKFVCDSNSHLIYIQQWGLQELKVPAYPEVRVFKEIRSQLLKKYPDMDATFSISMYGKKGRKELK